MKTHTRTIKPQLKIKASSPDAKKRAYKRLYQISNDAWRAANWVIGGQYLNDLLMRRVYARKKINAKKDTDAIQAVEKEIFDKTGFFGLKRQASTERDIKEAFPELPPCVTNSMNSVLFANYKKDKPDMLMGKRSLRSYKEGMPIQVSKASVTFFKEGNNHYIRWKLSRSEEILFTIEYGKDKANFQGTVSAILEGDLDFSAPQIQIKKRKTFLCLPAKEPERPAEIDPELSVGVNLGMLTPAYVVLADNSEHQPIGSGNDFGRVRLQMQDRRKRLQKDLKSARGGKGRKKKMKAMSRIRDKERNFARSYNHFVSKEILNFTTKNRAGVIKLEMLEGFGKSERNALVLRNWSYFELQEMVKYKAKRLGIKVVKVDPYMSSQTCALCGHHEKGQVDNVSKTFLCKACNKIMDSDHNAALNNAKSTNIVTKKEQCVVWKKNMKKKRLGSQPKGEAEGEALEHSPTS